MEIGSGGGNRTHSSTAYEAGAFPLGDSAVWEKRKWHDVPVLPRSRKVLEALLRKLAPAALIEMKIEMVRTAGLAPASPDWQTGILLLNDDRENECGAGCCMSTPAPLTTKKEQTPLPSA